MISAGRSDVDGRTHGCVKRQSRSASREQVRSGVPRRLMSIGGRPRGLMLASDAGLWTGGGLVLDHAHCPLSRRHCPARPR